MIGQQTRRDLGPQFDRASPNGCTKMAAAAQQHASDLEGNVEQRQVIAPALLTYTLANQSILLQQMTPSPASTDSLISRHFEDSAFSPIGPTLIQQGGPFPACQTPEAGPQSDDLLSKLSALLDRGLANTATKITGEIKANFQNLGSRTEAIEHKLDLTVATANQNSDHIQTLQDRLNSALFRIDELENRSRRYNFRIRGLPESIADISQATQEIIKSLILNILQHRLELDGVHRALGPLRKDGLPKDITKPHFYLVKEEIMK